MPSRTQTAQYLATQIKSGNPKARKIAIDRATAWNPNADGGVEIIRIDGSKVYVGGNFSSMGGVGKNFLARLNTGNNTVDSWNPNPSAPISAMKIVGNFFTFL